MGRGDLARQWRIASQAVQRAALKGQPFAFTPRHGPGEMAANEKNELSSVQAAKREREKQIPPDNPPIPVSATLASTLLRGLTWRLCRLAVKGGLFSRRCSTGLSIKKDSSE